MKSIPTVSKCLAFLLLSIIFHLSVIALVYVFDLFNLISILSILYAIIIIVISYHKRIGKMLFTVYLALLFTFIGDLLLRSYSVYFRILFYIYRNDDWVKETGRLSVQHTVGAGFGIISFWINFLLALFVMVVIAIIVVSIKSKKGTKAV